MFTLFCGYKFAVTHLKKEYAGIFDAVLRLCLIVGIVSGSLLMPIWLQKSRFPDVNAGYFLIGAYAGLILAGLTAFLEKKAVSDGLKKSKFSALWKRINKMILA